MVQCLRSWSPGNDKKLLQAGSCPPDSHSCTDSFPLEQQEELLLSAPWQERLEHKCEQSLQKSCKVELVSHSQPQKQNLQRHCCHETENQQSSPAPAELGATMTSKTCEHCGQQLWTPPWPAQLLLAHPVEHRAGSSKSYLRGLQSGSAVEKLIQPWALGSTFKHAKDQAAKPDCTGKGWDTAHKTHVYRHINPCSTFQKYHQLFNLQI